VTKVPLGFNERAAAQAARVVQLVARHVVPIFAVDDAGRPEFEASGVLAMADGTPLLVSAAHVFDSLVHGVHLLLRGRETLPLSSAARVSIAPSNRTRSFDSIDLGYVRLSDEEADAAGRANFAPVQVRQTSAERDWRLRYLLVGFPGKSQKRIEEENRYDLKQTYYNAPELRRSSYTKAALTEFEHIAVDFNRRRIQGATGRGGKPIFKGMSGCGVWEFNPYEEYSGERRPSLVGFLAGHPRLNHKALFGSNTRTLLRMLRTEAGAADA
jgi:hypothetical protein